MAKRPQSSSLKSKRKLRRVDPKRALFVPEFEAMRAAAKARIDQALATGAGLDELSLRNAFIFIVLLGTAARRFELCAFRCSDFYKNDNGPYARFDVAKGNIEAEIPISDDTWLMVQQWLAIKKQIGQPTHDEAPLFCGRDCGFLSPAQLNNIWNDLLEAAGVEKRKRIGVHAARHTAGMFFLKATESLPRTADFMRHSSEAITARFYRHVLPSAIRDGANKAGL